MLDGYIPRIDAAIRAGVMPPVIVIAVQALNLSGYLDSADGKSPMESVIVKDLIPTIDKTYRTVATREGRALQGHSMGGTATLRLGFKYPEMFGSIASISAALVTRGKQDPDPNDPDSLWIMAKKNADRIRGRINIQMIEGDKDAGLAGNRWMSDGLDYLRIPHEFVLSPGASHPVEQELAGLDSNPFQFYGNAFVKFK